jgi:uncharacterized repeat protein (TIGR03803 family)
VRFVALWNGYFLEYQWWRHTLPAQHRGFEFSSFAQLFHKRWSVAVGLTDTVRFHPLRTEHIRRQRRRREWLWHGFQVRHEGSVFEVLHLFNGSTSDGRGPHGAFLQSGPILYGTTQSGGSGNCGTVFQINTNDRSFQLLHSFSTAANDGKYPGMGALVLSGSNLFGMTSFGGANSKGAVFRVSTNGAGFQLLHSFTGGTNGQKPFGSVILSGSTLYGMTSDENTGTDGTIFSVSTEGADFRVLHRFKDAD